MAPPGNYEFVDPQRRSAPRKDPNEWEKHKFVDPQRCSARRKDPNEWEKHKSRIIKLYLKSKKLSDVLEQMQKDGFHAK